MPYRTLSSDHLITTVEKLERRIEERFPGCGLSKVCAELTVIARESRQKVATASRANIPLRIGVGIVAIKEGLCIEDIEDDLVDVALGKGEVADGVLVKEGVDAWDDLPSKLGAEAFQ